MDFSSEENNKDYFIFVVPVLMTRDTQEKYSLKNSDQNK